MSVAIENASKAQQARNEQLIRDSKYMRSRVASSVLPLQLKAGLSAIASDQKNALQALEIEAARIAIKSLGSLAKINELDHLGGGLDLIPALTLTLSVSDFEKIEYSIEHAHTSIGYYSVLAAYGFLDPEVVIETFRRGLDIPGHVSWVPGGTQSNGGRLGVMVPVAVGQALGKRAVYGDGSWMVCHCGDAGWISGQALNGFNGADLHKAPITFVMHRNGIQLSGSNKQIMDKDPRPIISSLGIEVLEIESLHDTEELVSAYGAAYDLAQKGRPTLIYPTGSRSGKGGKVDLKVLGERHGITAEVEAFAGKHNVPMDTEIWIPGALMSYRDVVPMLECIFLVNDLEGGEGHHDGHMKGRDVEAVLSNPMLRHSDDHKAALERLRKESPREVVTEARPAPGSPNLLVSSEDVAAVELPAVGKKTSARAGVQEGYALLAKKHPENVFIVSCDLDPSTKLGKARTFLKENHQFEMSIEEQVSALMACGLGMSTREPQLNVVSTFAAFYEGIAREGFEVFRYQRNLNGINEGLNVAMHMSHVGACTGRDHFSGWSLDWINLSLGYLPYLHRFYAPADARAAFVAIRDLGAHYGGHIIGIPRDNLPILAKQDGTSPLWEADSEWEAVTPFRTHEGAKKAILALGAPAFLAEEAAGKLKQKGTAVDAVIVNGFPLPKGWLNEMFKRYPEGLVTIEDGIIGCMNSGIRGLAGVVRSASAGRNVPVGHVGIQDPRIAPADGHMEVWEHFGITTDALVEAVEGL